MGDLSGIFLSVQCVCGVCRVSQYVVLISVLTHAQGYGLRSCTSKGSFGTMAHGIYRRVLCKYSFCSDSPKIRT